MYIGNVPELNIVHTHSDRYDYVMSGPPAVDTNPSCLYATWLNMATGGLFICKDNTVGANVWIPQSGVLSHEQGAYEDYVVLKAPLDGDLLDYSTKGNTLNTLGNISAASGGASCAYGALYTDQVSDFNPIGSDITIEGMFTPDYIYSSGSRFMSVGNTTASWSGSNAITILIQSAGAGSLSMNYWTGSSVSQLPVTGLAPTLDNEIYIGVCFNYAEGYSTTIVGDPVSSKFATMTGTLVNGSTSPRVFYGACATGDSAAYRFHGTMRNLRVTKGVARFHMGVGFDENYIPNYINYFS